MTQKLIILDLDGTTLNDDSKMSIFTKATLRKLDQAGHIVSIVTGRPYRLTKSIYQDLGIQKPIVNFNGSSAMIPNQKWSGSYQYTIDRSIVLDLLQDQAELGIEIMAAENPYSILSSQNATDQFAKETVGFFPNHLNPAQILTPKTLIQDPVELAIHFNPDKLENIKNYINEHYSDQVALSPWGGPYSIMELTTKGVNKATGIEALMNYYHINKANTLAFGDQINDIASLKAVGHPIAMKNAVPEIKAIAEHVTEFDNNHDGVARYLQTIFDY